MLGLPDNTKVNQPLSKQVLYKTQNLSANVMQNIDADISRITISNEISPKTVGVTAGQEIKAIYVLRVALKSKEFSRNTLVTLFKVIPQNLIIALEWNDSLRIAAYRGNLFITEWTPKSDFRLELKGLNLDKIWENIIIDIGQIELKDGNDIDTQIDKDAKQKKAVAEIERLRKKAVSEKQPKKKFELFSKIKELEEQAIK